MLPMDTEWFGQFNTDIFAETGWIWHVEHGWVYPLESNWAYFIDQGWIWTQEFIYPVLYRMHDQAWLWYFIGTSEPCEFYNFTTVLHETH